MTYIVRNTLALGVFLFLILCVGAYLTMVFLPKKLKAVNADIKKIETGLQNTPDLANNYNTLNAYLEETKKRWDTRSKDIPPRDITGETYGYFTRMIDQSGDVKMDVLYKGATNLKNYGYNLYDLKGEATFPDLFKFIWYIENGRRLFKISSLNLKGLETKDIQSGLTKILVTYEMEVQAYYSPVPELNIAPSTQVINASDVASNPFYPLILRDLPAPQPGEIEIERSELKAVIPGKAFIMDQNRKTQVLEEGSPVYLGYVTKILPAEGKIECLLNKGGVAEHFELAIRTGEPIK